MKTILNILWLIFSGVWMAMAYAVAGLICCILIITIPWGIACFRIAVYSLWPFGYRVAPKAGAGIASGIGNIIWLVVAGIWITLGHLAAGIAFCVTIIGIPFGIAHFKMIPVSLMPLGREIVPTDAPTYPAYRW
ncbi:YccF domain-containing protein [Streptomyces sp. 549]|uniref:YccF domain-containing protein n=1 Tax=Streptomyces sp. 549 TaxID=3049076 RepID=UPI0024C30BCE|nr:YccF domain-containing protein [Streptomyces sp. 549]MDK1472946.1 YccF domain-containing protein [Streptomyces sp. 549]